MKTKVQLAPRVAPSLKIKTSTLYIAGGIVLATVAGIIIFLQLNLGNNTKTLAGNGTFISRASGNWTSSSAWSGGSAPSTNLDRDKITIQANHTIQRTGNITGDNNVVITIQPNASLIINGDLEVDNNVLLNNSGTLIITGNLKTKNNAVVTVSGGGSMNVGGDIDFDNNTMLTVNGDLTVGGDVIFGNDNLSFTGTGTVKITGTGCNKWTGTKPCQSGPIILPVELLFFDATGTTDGIVKLEWATAMEKNNDYFTVQRSVDGITYSDLATVPGKGTTQEKSQYEFTDSEPLAERSYYRISQTDYDGTTEIFQPVMVDVKLKAAELSAYPNPFTGRNLTITLPAGEAGSLQIVDHRGEVLFSREVDTADKTLEVEFDRELPQGMYYANFKTSGGVSTLKIMKR